MDILCEKEEAVEVKDARHAELSRLINQPTKEDQPSVTPGSEAFRQGAEIGIDATANRLEQITSSLSRVGQKLKDAVVSSVETGLGLELGRLLLNPQGGGAAPNTF